MAAPQWSGGKCKSVQQAKAFFRHNDLEERQEARHTNPHIDKTRTKDNFSYRGLNYAGLCAALDARLCAVDVGRQSSGKNARVVMQSVIAYLPEGLASADYATKKRWFERVGDIVDAKYGDNFLDMQVDFDENHEYFDPEKKQLVMSREHGHIRLFPEVDGKLNCKQFSSRAAINSLNTALQEMTVREFGCVMMDGSKSKGGKTVEQLKAKSEAAKIRADAEAEARGIVAQAGVQAQEIIAKAQRDADELRERTKKEHKAAQEAAETLRRGAEGVECVNDMMDFMAHRRGSKSGRSLLEAFREQQQQQGKMSPEAAAAATAAAQQLLEQQRRAENERQIDAAKKTGFATVEREQQLRQRQGGKSLYGPSL